MNRFEVTAVFEDVLELDELDTIQHVKKLFDWAEYKTVSVNLRQVEFDPSQESYSWEEMANMNHAKQVELFGWCACEGTDGEGHMFEDCPREDQ